MYSADTADPGGVNALAAGEPRWVPSLNATAAAPPHGRAHGAGGTQLNGTAYLNDRDDAIAMRRDVADPLLARVPARNSSYYAGRAGPQDPAFVVESYAVPCNTTAEITSPSAAWTPPSRPSTGSRRRAPAPSRRASSRASACP